MIRTTKVVASVLLLAMVGMPAQAGNKDTGDANIAGANIVAGTPSVADRSVVSGDDVSLGTLHYNSVAVAHQAGGNSGGMMTDVFGGTNASSSVQVPEPGTMILGGLGLLILLASGKARGSRRS